MAVEPVHEILELIAYMRVCFVIEFLISYLTFARSDGSDETVQTRRLA